MDINQDFTGGLAPDDDYFLPEPPPYEWVREGASMWLFEESGQFALPRMGIEAEPSSWENRRTNAGAAFADGRILYSAGLEPMVDTLDASGTPSILGAGPLSFQCLEPFRRWRVAYDGAMVDTHVDDQLARQVKTAPQVPVQYAIELEMATPAFVQDTRPQTFFKLGKGEQRDGLSVGLGWRLEQMMRGQGTVTVDGAQREINVVGMRVKRRSIRTDGLFLRGHCWQGAVFPDGSAFGYLAYPVHADGQQPWNHGFVYVDGKMHAAKAVVIPWLKKFVARGDDVTVELESELGITRIEGSTMLSTFRLSSPDIWGLNLHQGGAEYRWNGQRAVGMIERSSVYRP